MACAGRRPRLPAVRLPSGRPSWRRLLGWSALGLVSLFLLAQVVPYGRNHSNPAVTKEPAWDSPRTRVLAARACFDCHSNQTTWKWYSNVAPVSWLVASDVSGGRSQFNFSEWDKPQDVSGSSLDETIRGGSMPPWFYTIVHSSAKLNAADREALIAGLAATLAASPPVPGGGG